VKVAISAGHNPTAPGAVFGTLTEHAAALDWIDTLKHALESFGIDVFVVPTGSLTAKIGAVNAEKCDAAMEVHFNSDPNHAGRGSETLYMPGSALGEHFAHCVQNQLGVVATPDRGVKEGWYRMEEGGQTDAFLRMTNCPALIVEPFFIHEPGVIIGKDLACAALARGVASCFLMPVAHA
jgi:N-acetylmuramoyl-L-alanine amidase